MNTVLYLIVYPFALYYTIFTSSFCIDILEVISRYMGMPLRITFNDKDYNFQIAYTEPITKSTVEIPVILNGETFNLVKGLKGWSPKGESDGLDIHLIQAIGRAIELRFRL